MASPISRALEQVSSLLSCATAEGLAENPKARVSTVRRTDGYPLSDAHGTFVILRALAYCATEISLAKAGAGVVVAQDAAFPPGRAWPMALNAWLISESQMRRRLARRRKYCGSSGNQPASSPFQQEI